MAIQVSDNQECEELRKAIGQLKEVNTTLSDNQEKRRMRADSSETKNKHKSELLKHLEAVKAKSTITLLTDQVTTLSKKPSDTEKKNMGKRPNRGWQLVAKG